MKKQLILAGMVLSTLTLTGCGGSNVVKGAAAGAVAGAVIGRSTGDHSDQRTREAAIIGAVGGAIIANERDKRR